MTSRLDVHVELIPRLIALVDDERRFRYYVAYGGRGSGKSWTFARVLLLQAQRRALRVLCVREIQRTIADSVHRLLADQIVALGLESFYCIRETTISGANGSEFLFAGLRGLDAGKIKSYEGIDVAWCEEGQAISKKSWEILIPTIRAEGSEIWVSFNPDLDSDDTYQRFVVSPPKNSWVQKVTYRDNPWFPAVLEQERLELLHRDKDEYDHVWEGNPRVVVEGAIYAKEVMAMIQARRYRALPYDPQLLVHTVWDLGWNDQTAIIFVQRLLSEVRIIDYEEESFLGPDEWAKRLRDKPYVYGEHWLPHDGANKLQSANGKSMQDLLTPLLRQKPRIRARPDSVEVPIRAARALFPRVYMDEEKCSRLMDCLKRFRRSIAEMTGEPGSPVKDEYRHGADAFGGLAMIVDKLCNEREKRRGTPMEYDASRVIV